MTNVSGMAMPMPMPMMAPTAQAAMPAMGMPAMGMAMAPQGGLVSPYGMNGLEQLGMQPQMGQQLPMMGPTGPTAPMMGMAGPMMVAPGMGIPQAMLPAGYGQMPASFSQAMMGAEMTKPPSKIGTIIKSALKTAAIGAAAGAAIGFIPRLPPTIFGGALIGAVLGAVIGAIKGVGKAKKDEEEFHIMEEQAKLAQQQAMQQAAPAHAPVARKLAAAHTGGSKPHSHYPDVASKPRHAKHAKTWVQLTPHAAAK